MSTVLAIDTSTSQTSVAVIKDGEVLISIVGGGSGLYGDGVRTFEMFDFREDEPQSYLLEDEINEHLKNNPFLNIAMTKQV